MKRYITHALRQTEHALHAARSLPVRRTLRQLRGESPVARALVAVIDDTFSPEERKVFRAIEEVRRRLFARTDAARDWAGARRVVGSYARRGSTRAPNGRLLYSLAREVRPRSCIEFGSFMGISGLYILAGLREHGGTLYTMEGAPDLSRIATANYDSLGFSHYHATVGDFDAALPDVLRRSGPVGLAFIDGNHQQEPTLRYDAAIRDVATPVRRDHARRHPLVGWDA